MHFLKPLILVILLYIGFALYYLPSTLESEAICIKCKLIEY